MFEALRDLQDNQVAMILALMSACLIFLFFSTSGRHNNLNSRLSSIRSVGNAPIPGEDIRARKRTIAEALRSAAGEVVADNTGFRLDERISQAGLHWSLTRFYTITILLAGTFGFLAKILFQFGFFATILGAILGGACPRLYVSWCRTKRFKAFESEFPNAIDIIIRGVRAGLPLIDCVRLISSESAEPVKSEFRLVIEDLSIGLPLDQGVERLTLRVPTAETRFFSIVVSIQGRSGGNLSEALSNLANIIRERHKIKLKIMAVSSEARASSIIIGSMPFAVAGLVYITSPNYIRVLFSDPIGQNILIVCAVWMVIGVAVMRKMINFDF